jgi:serine/threonine-protein kinase
VTSDPYNLLGSIVDGRYRVDAVAAHGGQAVVYRAFHLSFESPIALKVRKLPANLAASEARAKVAEFRREGRVLFELSSLHPSIVRALEVGVLTSCAAVYAPYLALEWLDGVALNEELEFRRQRGLPPLDVGEVIALLDAPSRALAVAHARGFAHRDIKPQNLFACPQPDGPFMKVLDFGISKWVEPSTSTTEQLAEPDARTSFTPKYAAPEQWLPRLGGTGSWTDVHAWALVIVELLSGKAPFEGKEAAQFMAACLDPLRPTPRNLGVAVTDEVELVFSRALALEPRERFRRIPDFWNALCHASRSEPRASRGVVLHTLTERPSTAPLYGGEERPVDSRSGAAPSHTAVSTRRLEAGQGGAPASVRAAVLLGTKEPRVKGVNLRTLDICFERLRGQSLRDAAHDRMPLELSGAFRYHTLLASCWYPMAWYRAMLRAICTVTEEGPELARALGRVTARHDLSGVYKQILARLLSPEALLAMSQRVFSTYYDTGRCEILDSRSGFAEVRCDACDGWDHNVWMKFAGACESMVQMAGGANPQMRVMAGGRDGDSSFHFAISWTQRSRLWASEAGA